VATAFALQADVRAQADDDPLVRAAGMRLAQADSVVELQFGEHEKIIPQPQRSLTSPDIENSSTLKFASTGMIL
jgi:hypothetical protein